MAAININKEQFESMIHGEKPILVDFWAPWCSYCRRIGPAYDKISNSALEEVIVSDTIPLSSDPAKDKSKITVLSMTKMFADIIHKVYNYEEISSSFIN